MSVEKKLDDLSIQENPAAPIAKEAAPATTETTKKPAEGEEVILGEDGQPLSKKALKKLLKEKEKAAKKAEREAQLAKEKLLEKLKLPMIQLKKIMVNYHL